MPKLWWPSRLWAALLSFAFPGLGQMFRGSYALGVAFGAVTVAAFITLELRQGAMSEKTKARDAVER